MGRKVKDPNSWYNRRKREFEAVSKGDLLYYWVCVEECYMSILTRLVFTALNRPGYQPRPFSQVRKRIKRTRKSATQLRNEIIDFAGQSVPLVETVEISVAASNNDMYIEGMEMKEGSADDINDLSVDFVPGTPSSGGTKTPFISFNVLKVTKYHNILRLLGGSQPDQRQEQINSFEDANEIKGPGVEEPSGLDDDDNDSDKTTDCELDFALEHNTNAKPLSDAVMHVAKMYQKFNLSPAAVMAIFEFGRLMMTGRIAFTPSEVSSNFASLKRALQSSKDRQKERFGNNHSSDTN